MPFGRMDIFIQDPEKESIQWNRKDEKYFFLSSKELSSSRSYQIVTIGLQFYMIMKIK